MGQPESKPSNFARFIKQYQKREETKDDRFGDVTIYNHAHNPTDLIMVKEKWNNTPPDAAQLNDMSDTRVNNNHKNLAKMLIHGVQEDNQMCSTFYKHYMAFEYFPKNLEQEISEKTTKGIATLKEYYSEPEVWYIIDALVSLDKSFKDRGYHHGDIQPKNIFIDPHGYIKLVDNSLVNYGRNGYFKMVFEPGYKAALSPELLKSYQMKEMHPASDPIKSDIFSIGITTLCAALNKNLDDFYNWTSGTLKPNAIKQSLDQMNQAQFSHQLISTVGSFLEENEDRRSSLEEIHGFLSRYQEAIRQGQLNFQGVPPPTVPIPPTQQRAGSAAGPGAFQTSVLPGQPGFPTQSTIPANKPQAFAAPGASQQFGAPAGFAGQQQQITPARYP